MWFNTLVTLLLYQYGFSLRILQDSHSRIEHEGSGCQQSSENYFDYINVDDEDYYEDGSAVGYIKDHEDFVDKGPPVFTDTLKEDVIQESIENLHESSEELKSQIENETKTSPFLPENLVLNNETHGSLNGKFLISNSGQGTILDLYFEDQKNSTREQKDSNDSKFDIDNSRNVILTSDVSSSSKDSYFVFVVCSYLISI